MSTVTFARGGMKAPAGKPGKPGAVEAILNAVTGNGGTGALNGTVNGKRGFQKGNTYASKAHRNQTVASAKSNFTARHAVVRKHVKAGTATTKAGRAAIKDAAAAGRELQAARAAHVAGKAADAKAARAIKSGRAEPLTPRPASAAPKSADHPMVARVEKSKAEVATVQAARATQHLHDLHAGAKAGAIKGADVGRHVDRIARGTTKDQLFAAAKAAGIEHTAGTKKALVDHLKVHAHLQAAGKAPTPAAPLSSKDFADRVNRAAQDAKTGHFGSDQVFISHVRDSLRHDPHIGKMGEAEFKAKLLEAHRDRHLTLGRADLVEAMHPGDVKASRVTIPGFKDSDPAAYHFIARTPAKAAGRKKDGHR